MKFLVKLSDRSPPSFLVMLIAVATVRVRIPVEESESTIRLSTRFFLPLHGHATSLRLCERMEDSADLAATPAVMSIGLKAIIMVPALFALPPVVICDPGKGHRPGCTCLHKASGEAGSTTLASSRLPASGKGSVVPRLVSTSTTRTMARTLVAGPSRRR